MNRFALMLLTFSCCLPAAAQLPFGPDDYPQWRGPHRDGISTDTGLLKEWPDTGPEVVWRIDNIGAGYSSVAIKDGTIITMGDLGGVEHTIALNSNDGARIWAVQPERVARELEKRVLSEFGKLDANQDGTVSELEALTRLGWDFYKYDADETSGSIGARAQVLFGELDKDGNGKLSYAESRSLFGDRISRMDTSVKMDKEAATALAESRADLLIGGADKDGDGKVSKKEARANYLGQIMRNADQRVPGERRGDEVLTREEIVSHLAKRERGKDGDLTRDELVDYYESNVDRGDGKLTLDELSGYYGGYRNGQGDGPRGTPTIDGDRVYAEGGNGDVSCLDLRTGTTIWHVSMTADLGGGRPAWGYSESPLVVGDWVIVTPGGDQGTLAALDKTTGEVIWRSTDITEKAHYSSPILATIAGRKQIVQFARESMFGVDLTNGKLLWQYDGANNTTANCCTPVVHADHVFAASAYGTGGGLAKITNDGEVQKAQEVYFEKKMAIHHGGIVKIGDYLYSNGASTLTCIHFLTGDIAWQDRCVGKGSLTAADGMLYVLGEKQKLALVEATPEEYRERGQVELQSYGRPSWAHPVVAGGVLYVRDQYTLTAYKAR